MLKRRRTIEHGIWLVTTRRRQRRRTWFAREIGLDEIGKSKSEPKKIFKGSERERERWGLGRGREGETTK